MSSRRALNIAQVTIAPTIRDDFIPRLLPTSGPMPPFIVNYEEMIGVLGKQFRRKTPFVHTVSY
jgi:hypothetical protein